MVTEDRSDRYILTTIEMTVLHVHTENMLNRLKLKLRAWSFFYKGDVFMQYAAVEGHLGNNYIAKVDGEEDIELIEEICETCFDSDSVLGVYDTKEEAEKHL